ncbi:MAG: CsbD family protein [Synechocystis sp.]|jgi:uncharacterized protein YjbJ (UPF0337 family)
MSTEGKINATAKNLEGKAQEALGNLTGDTEMQLEGKGKQMQASAMNLVDNLKDKAANAVEAIQNTIDKA